MTHKLKSLVGILAIGLVAFASCKKKSDDSAKAKLTGKWKVTKQAVDANNNGSMDANEVTAAADSISQMLTFNGDGTGTIAATYAGSTISEPMTWKLINSDKDIVTTTTYAGTSSTDTVHIESLTSSDLEVSGTTSNTTTGTTVKQWIFLHKQ